MCDRCVCEVVVGGRFKVKFLNVFVLLCNLGKVRYL